MISAIEARALTDNKTNIPYFLQTVEDEIKRMASRGYSYANIPNIHLRDKDKFEDYMEKLGYTCTFWSIDSDKIYDIKVMW